MWTRNELRAPPQQEIGGQLLQVRPEDRPHRLQDVQLQEQVGGSRGLLQLQLQLHQRRLPQEDRLLQEDDLLQLQPLQDDEGRDHTEGVLQV